MNDTQLAARPSQAVLLLGDSTLRGYARLSLLMADISTIVVSPDVFFGSEDERHVSVVVIDRDIEPRLVAASTTDPLLLRRTVLLDPTGSAELNADRQLFFAVLQRVDAENIVRAVRGCMATTPEVAPEEATIFDAPEPATAAAEISIPAAEPTPPPPLEPQSTPPATVAVTKKAAPRPAPRPVKKSSTKPKRRR